jgi:hypothetical protein
MYLMPIYDLNPPNVITVNLDHTLASGDTFPSDIARVS